MSEPVIRMENIVKTYYLGKPNELEILHGINLTVNKGEFVSIVGESGSGKSTLMNIIGVLDRQTQGDYYPMKSPLRIPSSRSLLSKRWTKIPVSR